MTTSRLRLFIRMSYPLYLLSGVILYSLGAGIARFLESPIDWSIFWLGLAWLFFFQASGHYLNAYFCEIPALGTEFHSPLRGAREVFGPEKLSRQAALWAGYVTLAVTASLSVIMFRGIPLTPVIALLLPLIVLGVIVYAIPPLRQVVFSYRELIVSIWMASLVPAFSFLLQAGEIHRMVAMATLPLVALHLAVTLVFGLEDFALDIRYEVPSFLARIGWREGMNLHNYLILGAYVLVVAGYLMGVPVGIAWPILVTLPLAGYHTWTMLKIARGARPLWRSLEASVVALFLVVSYLTAYGYWMR